MVKEICSNCGKITNVHIRLNNEPLCRACYSAPKHCCSFCHKEKEIHLNLDNGEKSCKSCYYKYIYVQETQLCSICGKFSIIVKNENNALICKNCYKSPFRYCSKCGKLAKVAKIVNKENICMKCYKSPSDLCFLCNKIKPVHCRKPEGNLCAVCYTKYRIKTDPEFHLRYLIRYRAKNALKSYLKIGKVYKIKDYGIDIEAIAKFLGPCPGNRTEYHIDHIFPLIAFDLNKQTHIKAAFAPENHQWLKKEENLKKNAKFDENNFKNYILLFEVNYGDKS